jgi:fructokinase
MALPATATANTPPSGSRFAIGIDLGGSKTEAVVLDAAGAECWRQRIATPSARGYAALIEAIAGLVAGARQAVGLSAIAVAGDGGSAADSGATVGLGTPGSLTAAGLIKNANTQCLNGRPLAADLATRLRQPLRIANDANCLALSEATDGAGKGATVVFAAILGTGCGAGISVAGRVLTGPNRLAGEWGHNPLPWARDDEPGLACYCGQTGCVETWLSGPGLAADHLRLYGVAHTALQIAQAAAAGDVLCQASIARWHDRLARALAGVINLLDPDVIVLGGGLSRLADTYRCVPGLWDRWVFSGDSAVPVRTRLLPALYGDASGVRGAAWLGRRPELMA